MKPDVTPHWISLNVSKKKMKKNTTKHLILIRLQGGKLIFRFRDFQFSDKGRYFNQKKETEC